MNKKDQNLGRPCRNLTKPSQRMVSTMPQSGEASTWGSSSRMVSKPGSRLMLPLRLGERLRCCSCCCACHSSGHQAKQMWDFLGSFTVSGVSFHVSKFSIH